MMWKLLNWEKDNNSSYFKSMFDENYFTSRHRRRLGEFVEGMILASTAALRIKNLCSSLQSAGTVITHLTLEGITFPIYSFNFSRAYSAIYLKVSLTITIRGISLPSTLLPYVFKWSRWILYYFKLKIIRFME